MASIQWHTMLQAAHPFVIVSPAFLPSSPGVLRASFHAALQAEVSSRFPTPPAYRAPTHES